MDGLRQRGITPLVPDEQTQQEIHRIILKNYA
ncbi:RacX protein [Actinobacillus equuli]|nr:RacX protein [Actinobacillus equuli]